MPYVYRGVSGLSLDADVAAIDVVQEKLIDGLRLGRTAVAKTAATTLALTDVGELITCSGTWTLTVPRNVTVAFSYAPVTILLLQNISSGTITVAPFDGSVTILGPSLTLAAYQSGTLLKIAENTWIFASGQDTSGFAPLASPTFTGTVTLPGTTAGSSSITGTLTASGAGKFSGLGAITICTSSTRPGSPSAGQVIYETDTALFFGYNSTAWSSIGGGGATYQASAPTATLVGALWVDSDDTTSTLNTNDFLLKSEAAVTYATKTELGNAGYSPFLLMGA